MYFKKSDIHVISTTRQDRLNGLFTLHRDSLLDPSEEIIN